MQGKNPATLADLFQQAEYYKMVEQSLADNKKSELQSSSKGRNIKKSLSLDRRGRGRSPNRVNATSDRRRWGSPSNYDKGNTQLAASIEYIYEVTKDMGLYRKLAPLNAYQIKDKSKYCEYHQSTGHNTSYYRQLMEEIEFLIKE